METDCAMPVHRFRERAHFLSPPAERTRGRQIARLCGEIFCLLLIPAFAAWATGRPFIFPSLGPSAFALALGEDAISARRIIGGHSIGIAAGVLSYHLLAWGLTFTTFPVTWSVADLRLAASGIISLLLTSAGMLATHTRHSPACATTLIVSLGLLPSLADCAIIFIGVLTLYGTHQIFFMHRISRIDTRGIHLEES